MEQNDLRFNDVRGSLPARRSLAHSPEYTKGDPLRLHSLHEMERPSLLCLGPARGQSSTYTSAWPVLSGKEI